MKTKFLFFIVVALLQTMQVSAQSQNNLLSIPPNYFIPGNITMSLPAPGGTWFLNPSPPAPPIYPYNTYIGGYNGQLALHGHNAMQDAQGNLLFFIVDSQIYDRNGWPISGLSGSHDVTIVPDPGNCQRYYLFYTTDRPFYSILDLSLPHDNFAFTGQIGNLVVIGGDTEFSISPMINMTYTGAWYRARPSFAATKLRPNNSPMARA